MREPSGRMIYRTLPHSITFADSFTTRFRGLMFRKRPLNLEGLLITPCNAIHMCFMTFSIDAVFLNSENKVIKLIPNLTPWRFTMPVKEARSVLELPAGTISEYKLKVNDHLQF
ncbi:DUF192 domain-containing protein [Alkalihalobacillus sp. CinArs1]|uniref:DUF192 domain-containing protein n=1 Tax=Alkalihalobacillus sp. CinArs1 TaxID=2995314 RepID=UPI0022DD83D4|nr:DUF192 domain-containing protein [Alkalihalobacillus sp. CinArs1]